MELLIVVAILAVIAGSMIATYEGTAESAAAQIVPHEMLQLKQALLRFKQDTGYLPGQGPFNRVSNGGQLSDAIPEAWLHSPANFAQLFYNPLDGSTHPLSTWDPMTRRGWKGPYLALQGNGTVTVPADWLPASGVANPPGYGGSLVTNVNGVADPHIADSDNGYFSWISGTRQGRPYLLFQDSANLLAHQATIAGIVGLNMSATLDDSLLVCLGADGQFGTSDDVVVFLFR